MVCCKCTKLLLIPLVGFLLAVAFLPDTRTYFGFDIKIVDAPDIPLPESFSGALLANQLLNPAVHLYKNEVYGPEAFAEYKGSVYTGLADGRIIRLEADRFETVAHLDPEGLGTEQCSLLTHHDKCGHPLGIRFDSRGLLLALDPFHGLWSVNVTTGAYRLMVSKEKLDNSLFLDNFVIIEKPNGRDYVLYMSDCLTWGGFEEVTASLAQHDESGRLLSYDTETEKVKVEASGLPFPNGVELTDDKSAILLASFTGRLIYKYQIHGAEAGKLTTLVSNLPGEPDNIRRSRSKDETYWIALFTARNQNRPHKVFDTLMVKHKFLARFTLRLQRAIGFTIQSIGSLINCPYLHELGLDIKLGISGTATACEYGMAVEIDAKGRIVNSLHSPDGSTCALSELHELEETESERHFWLGSAFNRYLGKLSVPKSKLRTVRDLAQEVEKQKPKTTTTSNQNSKPKTQKSSTTNQKVEL